MISVVIPTRNRKELLLNLLSLISMQSHKIEKVIVIDSSDKPMNLEESKYNFGLKYIHTNIKSAAIQRNIGINHVPFNTKYLFFLDDDVMPNQNYVKDLITLMELSGAVGCSGIAVKPGTSRIRLGPIGLKGVFQRLFLLDSKNDGVLLKSGVNIPVRTNELEVVEVAWLIACSAWNFEKVEGVRFEDDFFGASLAEDVIFSLRMGNKGKLVTSPRVLLPHLESKLARENERVFWKMWVINRSRVIEVAGFGVIGQICLWWSSFGQMLIFVVSSFKKRENSFDAIIGILLGLTELLSLK